MRRLIIDTATEALSVALFAEDRLVADHHERAGRGHAEKLIPILDGFPDGGRADEIWVDSGPGSFTGVRVGLAAARALSYAWGATLSAYSSLSLLAAIARDDSEGAEGVIAVVMTGGHGELFWQMFDSDTLDPAGEPASTPIAELAKSIMPDTLYGSGAEAAVAARGWGRAVPLLPDARRAQKLQPAHIRADTAPLYGRGADAVPIAAAGPA